MPNHCENELTIVVKNLEDLNTVEKLFQGHDYPWEEYTNSPVVGTPTEFAFENFIPIPDEVKKKGYNDAGYAWCTETWGTKWPPYEVCVYKHEDTFELIFTFESAWGPPDQVIHAIVTKLHELNIKYRLTFEYGEPGCDFSGHLIAEDGRIICDEQGNYGEYYGERSEYYAEDSDDDTR